MPTISSAKKRVRQIARRTEVNKNRIGRIRSAVRKVEEALAAGDKKAAIAAFRLAEPEIMRGTSKGVIHKRTGARKVSRLAQRLKALSG
jgi:small subunit ribosomal protein S20